MYNNNQSATDNQFQGNTHRGFCGHFGNRFRNKFGGGNAPWAKHFGGMFNSQVTVNIEEDDTAYYLSLYAPGLNKESFKIAIENNILSIAYQKPQSEESTNKYAHREYNPGSFERLFQLNDKILPDQTSAAYNEGILRLVLPKNPETCKPAQHINIK